jgi:hypothetical protein
MRRLKKLFSFYWGIDLVSSNKSNDLVDIHTAPLAIMANDHIEIP